LLAIQRFERIIAVVAIDKIEMQQTLSVGIYRIEKIVKKRPADVTDLRIPTPLGIIALYLRYPDLPRLNQIEKRHIDLLAHFAPPFK
jgi:hypothetical protein